MLSNQLRNYTGVSFRDLCATVTAAPSGVRAVIHRTNSLYARRGLEIVRADVRNPNTMTGLFNGIDAVMASLGSARSSPPDVAGTGAETITALMADHQPRRLVTVTGSAAVLPDERLTSWHAMKRSQMLLGSPRLLADGDRHLGVLADTDLDWTTLRVPFMTREDTPGYELTPTAPHPGSNLPYKAAAAAMLDLIASTAWHRAAPFVAAAAHDTR